MKKTITILIIMVVLVSLTACRNTQETTQETIHNDTHYITSNVVSEPEDYNVLNNFTGNWEANIGNAIILHIFSNNDDLSIYITNENIHVYNNPINSNVDNNQLTLNFELYQIIFALVNSNPGYLTGTYSQFGEINEITFKRISEIPEKYEKFFTKQQIIDDFNEMLEILKNNYPHFSTANRVLGSNKNEIIEQYKTKFNNLQENAGLYQDALQLFGGFIGEFGAVGHLKLGGFWDFKDPLNIIQETPTNVNGLIPITSNLEYKIMDEDTVYLIIYSFNANIEEERIELDKFFEEIMNYKNLIIDISKNSGGSDLYWMENIVAPNITRRTTAEIYGLAKSAGIHSKYNNENYNRDSGTYNIIKNMPLISNEILDEFDIALRSSYSVRPRNGEKAFSGNIYVLIGNETYSASEGFAMFCKETGFATLVGSNSGGDGGVLLITEFNLTNTGLSFLFSTAYSLNPDGTSNTEFGTTPDIFAAPGQCALEACLEYIKSN